MTRIEQIYTDLSAVIRTIRVICVLLLNGTRTTQIRRIYTDLSAVIRTILVICVLFEWHTDNTD